MGLVSERPQGGFAVACDVVSQSQCEIGVIQNLVG